MDSNRSAKGTDLQGRRGEQAADRDAATMRLLRGVAMAVLVVAAIGGGICRWTPAAAAPAAAGRVVRTALEGYTPLTRPMPAPPTAFVDGRGQRGDLHAFAGQVVLLNLWATWCAPCVSEMPSLDRLAGRLGGRDFRVVALSVDRRGRQAVAPFLARLGLTHLDLYLDPEGRALDSWGVSGLPTSIVIGRDGQVLGKIAGEADWDSPEAVRLIQGYLNQESAPDRRPAPVPRPSGVINTRG